VGQLNRKTVQETIGGRGTAQGQLPGMTKNYASEGGVERERRGLS